MPSSTNEELYLPPEALKDIPADWHEPLRAFLRTGEASAALQKYLDDTPACQQVVDQALAIRFDQVKKLFPPPQAATQPEARRALRRAPAWAVFGGTALAAAVLGFGVAAWRAPSPAELRALEMQNRDLRARYEWAQRPREPRETLAEMRMALAQLPAWLAHDDERVQASTRQVLQELPGALQVALPKLPPAQAEEVVARLNGMAANSGATPQDREALRLNSFTLKLWAPLAETRDKAQMNLISPNENVRIQAARTLGQLGPAAEAAVPALITRLKTGQLSVAEKKATEDALAQISPDAALRLARQSSDKTFDPTRVNLEVLRGELASADAATRIRTARELADLGVRAKSVAPALSAAYEREKDPWTRWEFAAALKQIDPELAAKSGLPARDELLGGPVPVQQRRLAGWALCGLEAKDAAVRGHAAQALTHIGPDAVPTFPRVLELYESENDKAVKQLLGQTLKAINPIEAGRLGVH